MAFSKISFIGGGRVSWLLLKSLHNKNALPQTVVATDPDEAALQKVKAIAPEMISCSANNKDAVDADVIFLAVHPPVLKSVLPELNGQITEKSIVVSLAPVIKITHLSEALGHNRIVRMIPNAPSLLGAGYNPVAFADTISVNDKDNLFTLFSHWGSTPMVDEKKLEAYAIISAMGPTYFWFQWQELERLGLEFRLTEKDLNEAIPAIVSGAVATMYRSGLSKPQIADLIPVHPFKNMKP